MEIFLISIFILGYLIIALEHPLKIDKAATALVTGVLCWVIYIMFAGHFIQISDIPASFMDTLKEGHATFSNDAEIVRYYIGHFQIIEHLGEISNILFFLMGAMSIVELIDAYEGFAIITDRIKAVKKIKLLWIVSLLTFFLSAVLDNLTTSIVMVSLLSKLIYGKKNRLFFAGMVVIAANAGGAFSPIGDVTTTMLWIGGQVTVINIIKVLFLPSLVCLIVPLTYLTFTMSGDVQRPPQSVGGRELGNHSMHQVIILTVGVCGLIFVPIFKTVTGLPPFMGMVFSLGVIWITAELVNRNNRSEDSSSTNIVAALKRVDTPSILFFLGILTAVAALQSAGTLNDVAEGLDKWIGNQTIIVLIIGLLSSIVDNVPLVAAGMGMYHYAPDSFFWEFLAYCAGTGGSVLIIGSAAGVAVMGIEKIDFIWYAKRMSFLALLGYFSGAVVYILTDHLLMSL